MSKKLFTALVLASVAALSQTVAVAIDTVYLKAGGTRAGTVESQDKDKVVVKTSKGSETIPAVEVERIAFTGEPSSMRLAPGRENSGLFDDAIEMYTKARNDFKGSGSGFGKEVDFAIARTTARMGLADPSKINDAITKLNTFTSNNTTNFRYYAALNWLGRCQMAAGQTAEAKTTYGKLKTSAANSHKMTATNAEARIMLAEGSTAEALAQFKQVAAMNAETAAEQASKFDALLGTAECEKADKQFDQAITSLNNVIEQTPSEEASVQARAYLLQGDCYREQQKFKAAAIAYLHVDVLYASEAEIHAQALYWLGKMWGQTEPPHPARAEQAANKLKSVYPNSEWAKKP